MQISKSELDSFCENLLDLETQKKELANEFKECVEAFASAHEIDKKSVKKFFKEYKDALKDKEEYTLTDYESDQLLLIVFPEFNTESPDA